MRFFDLSFRYKIPLWGSVLILVSTLAVSATLMIEAFNELRDDLVIDAQTLGIALTPTLSAAMSRDDAWAAYASIAAALNRAGDAEHAKFASAIVVDNSGRIYVAAPPPLAPMMTELRLINADYAAVAERLQSELGESGLEVTPPQSDHLYLLVPISDHDVRYGTLILALNKQSVLPRFSEIAGRGLLVGTVILCILLPFNWYWGRRMAEPLVQLIERMRTVGRQLPETLDPVVYSHRDELGSLFNTYNKMLADLKAREDLERQVVQSDRLAALGQLAAGVAHEINNPLGGMLMAIDTLKSHAVTDPLTSKTIALIERGLGQIKETVGALLVEAKTKSRRLTTSDIEDVLLLVLPQAHGKRLKIDWHNQLSGEVALPATLVRQVLINLLLNAIRAADADGEVACHLGQDGQHLTISITNDGKILTADEMKHLFEPFSPLSEGGHGLGLWVCYQIVRQLGGSIGAMRKDRKMRFDVELPLGEGDI
jgi:signal transduction histidine kinase